MTTPTDVRTGHGVRGWLRAQCSQVLAVVAVTAVLPVVVVAEVLRPGSGRAIAGRACRSLGRFSGVHFDTRGTERLDPDRTYVLVPNHSSFLDIPAVLLAGTKVRFVAAAGLFRIPILAAAMRALGTEPIDRHHPAAALRQLSELADLARDPRPRWMVIFAEGRMAPAGQRLPFRNGAFTLAIDAGVPVVPVAIHGAAQALPPGARFAVRPGSVTVDMLAPIDTAGMSASDRDELRDRVRQAVVERLAAGPSPDPPPAVT